MKTLATNRPFDPEADVLGLDVSFQTAESPATPADVPDGNTGVLNTLVLADADVSGFGIDRKPLWRAELTPGFNAQGRPTLLLTVYAVNGAGAETRVYQTTLQHTQMNIDAWLAAAGYARQPQNPSLVSRIFNVGTKP